MRNEHELNQLLQSFYIALCTHLSHTTLVKNNLGTVSILKLRHCFQFKQVHFLCLDRKIAVKTAYVLIVYKM